MSHSVQNKSTDQGNSHIYSEPLYSYPTSPPVKGAHINLAFSSSPTPSRNMVVKDDNFTDKQNHEWQGPAQTSIYGTLPRAHIRRRQPLQRIDSENSETDNGAKSTSTTVPLTKATSFFDDNENDEQDYYGESASNIDLERRQMEQREQIINARHLQSYATFRQLPGVPHQAYFQHNPSLLCGPLIPLQLASPGHHQMIQKQTSPMSQWSRDDLHLMLTPENGGGEISGSSGRSLVLDSKHHFKNKIRKLEHRQQRISRSFEQLVELTEPDEDEEEEQRNATASLSVLVPDKINRMHSNTSDVSQQDVPRKGAIKHENNVDNSYANSSSDSPNSDSSANDIRYTAVCK